MPAHWRLAAGELVIAASNTKEVIDLLLRMARDNSAVRDHRLQGALANPGYPMSSGTVAYILKRHGIEPAPERGKRTS